MLHITMMHKKILYVEKFLPLSACVINSRNVRFNLILNLNKNNGLLTYQNFFFGSPIKNKYILLVF